MPRTKQTARKGQKGKKRINKKKKQLNQQSKPQSRNANVNHDYNFREQKPINYRKAKNRDLERTFDHYDSDEELEKIRKMELKFPGFGTDLLQGTEDESDDDENDDCDIDPNTNTNDKVDGECTKPDDGTSDPIKIERDSPSTKSDDARKEEKTDGDDMKIDDKSELNNEPIKNEDDTNESRIKTEQQETGNNDDHKTTTTSDLDQNPFLDADGDDNNSTPMIHRVNDISPHWDYEDLKLRKDKVFGIKHHWNLIAPYFETTNMGHVLEEPLPVQSNANMMVKQCIDGLLKTHGNTLPESDEMRMAMESFVDQYDTRYSDSMLRFNGIKCGAQFWKKRRTFSDRQHGEPHVEQGRSVRIGFYSKGKDEVKLLVVYADNKQFVEESQQYFALKIGEFVYESRRWALADDPAHTEMTGDVVDCGKKWMSVALIVGISVINRFLNPSIPKTPNSIWRLQLVDVTELLPPFDDLPGLLRNDAIWWNELTKRLEKGFEDDAEERSSDGSEYAGSLKDFIDDSVIEQPVDIKAVMDQHVFGGGNVNGSVGGTLIENVLRNYNEENDGDYQDKPENGDDGDYANYVDMDFEEDFQELIGGEGKDDVVKDEKKGKEEESDSKDEVLKKTENLSSEKISSKSNNEEEGHSGKKRKLERTDSVQSPVAGNDNESSVSSSFEEPQAKRQRTDSDGTGLPKADDKEV